MASPIPFKPEPIDPHQELMRRLEAAPRQHAEALLVTLEMLQTAHDKGLLDLLHGLMGGRDIVASKVALAMKQRESLDAMRNAIALARVLAAFPPDMLQHFAQEMEELTLMQQQEAKPPSLWKIIRTVFSEEGRRGIWFAAGVLVALGRASRRK